MRTLAAGPWIGEFGFELFFWQGHLRALAANYDRVIVAGRSGHGALYADFAHAYRTYDSPTGPCICISNRHGTDFKSDAAKLFRDQHNCDRIEPYTGYPFRNGEVIPEYVMLGQQNERYHYDMVFAARDVKLDITSNLRPIEHDGKLDRNWGAERWTALQEAFKDRKICSIGAKDSSLHVPGTVDLRGLPLGKLVNVLASSTCIVGASSGTMHLASLCGCPQVVWLGDRFGGDFLVDRYNVDWNPFGTKVNIATRYEWQPDVDFIVSAIWHSDSLFPRMPKRPECTRVRHTAQRSLASLSSRTAPFKMPRIANNCY